MCETKMAASNGIDPIRLDPEQYVLSLIGQALQKGLLRESDVQIFQTGCYGFLAELSRQWNGERSSSIRVEDAQMLIQSMLWLIGLVLKEQPAPEQALILLKRTPVKALYNEGLQIAQRKTRTAKIRWAQAAGRLFQTKCSFYPDAFQGMRGFFQVYRPAFAAHEIHITADYPTFIPIVHLAGIEFIETYLQRLCLENDFLCRFDAAVVHALFDRRIEHGADQLFNLFEVVWLAAMGCICAGRSVQQLAISKDDRELLESSFGRMDREQISGVLSRARRKLVQELDLLPALDIYVQQGERRLAGEIALACQEHWLDRLFPADDQQRLQPIVCIFGQKMPDPEFRMLLDRLSSSNSEAEKLELIRSEIRSLADLEDLLLADCLTSAETEAVQGLLTPQELAALWQRHALVLSAKSDQLAKALQGFLQKYPPDVQSRIQMLAGRIEILV